MGLKKSKHDDVILEWSLINFNYGLRIRTVMSLLIFKQVGKNVYHILFLCQTVKNIVHNRSP